MGIGTKELMQEAIRSLPEDASLEEAMERLLFLAKIEKGLADAEDGRTFSTDEVRQRLAR